MCNHPYHLSRMICSDPLIKFLNRITVSMSHCKMYLRRGIRQGEAGLGILEIYKMGTLTSIMINEKSRDICAIDIIIVLLRVPIFY